MIAVLVVFGCSGDPDDPAVETPELSILEPADGASVPAGDVSVSLVVEHFVLVEPSVAATEPARGFDWFALSPVPAAWAHETDGTPTGWVSLRLDGAEVATTGETVHTLLAVPVGSHELSAELFHDDGDPLDPPITATSTFEAVAPE
jgi:hypothetical protein